MDHGVEIALHRQGSVQFVLSLPRGAQPIVGDRLVVDLVGPLDADDTPGHGSRELLDVTDALVEAGVGRHAAGGRERPAAANHERELDARLRHELISGDRGAAELTRRVQAVADAVDAQKLEAAQDIGEIRVISVVVIDMRIDTVGRYEIHGTQRGGAHRVIP